MANDYSEFLVQEIGPIPDSVREAAETGPASPESGLPYHRRGELLKEERSELETGFTRLPDDMIYVAVHHELPGVDASMIRWWFGWHGFESARYRLWHPSDHKRAAWKEPAPSVAPGGEEAYLGHTSLVDESINGGEVQKLAIRFSPPQAIFGSDLWKNYFNAGITANGLERAAICGRVGRQKPSIDAGHVIHLVTDTERGCTMRSRFWLGDFTPRGALSLLRPVINRPFIRRKAFGLNDGKNLLIHCAEEMGHFPKFLPALHSKYAKSESTNT